MLFSFLNDNGYFQIILDDAYTSFPYAHQPPRIDQRGSDVMVRGVDLALADSLRDTPQEVLY